MADLVLQHKEIKSHKEYWTIKDGGVNIHSVCPKNYPSEEKFDITPFEALRYFALLTSMVENWEVVQESDAWHNFVDGIRV